MPASAFFTKELGNEAGVAINICIVQGTSNIAYGVQLSAVESSASRDRVYRVSVKSAGNPLGWRRLVPSDRTESGTTWAVDVSVNGTVSTFRAVRTQTSATSSTIKFKVMAQSAAGGSVTVEDSQATATDAVDVGVYDGALLTQVDGNVGIGTDTPQATLDVRGGAIISGNVILGGLTKNSTGNGVYVDVETGQLYFGQVASGNVQTGLADYTDLIPIVQGTLSDIVYRWTSRVSAADNNWQSIAYGSGIFVAVASTGTGRRVMTSSDGITWTWRTYPNDNQWRSVVFGNGLFVAVAISGVGNRVMTSPDGITWTSRQSAADNPWQCVAFGNDTFVAVATTGTNNRVMTSQDGSTWTIRSYPVENAWQSITFGNGLFVAVSTSGVNTRVMTSPDGITWTGRTSAADNSWQSVTFGNGLFVAVSITGTGNRVMTSPDGIAWTSRSTPVDNNWQSVTVGGDFFVAVSVTGSGNRVMTSTNGVNWTTRSSAADNSWQAVAYGNGTFVAVSITGSGNRVMTWSPSTLENSPVSGVLYYSADTGLVSYGPLVIDVTLSEIQGSLNVNGNLFVGGNSISNIAQSFVSQSITDGITTSAPSENAVFDALSLKPDADNVYTKTQLDGGQLDGRYYTETEINNLVNAKANVANAIISGTLAVSANASVGNLSTNTISATAVSASSLTVSGNNLNTLLNAKENAIAASTTATYFRGDKTFQTLTTTAVPEGSNLYFTNVRARTATVSQTITDGVTTTAPSENAVFDALVLKANASDVYTEAEVNTLLNAKENAIAASTTATYFRGDKTFQTLTTTAVPEGSNLYFTNVRAQTALVTQLNAKANLENAAILGTLSVSGNASLGNVSTNAISTTTATALSLSVSGNTRTGNAVTVGTSEIWNLQNQNEKWRLTVGQDISGNFFQIEAFVTAQWQPYLRIDK